MDGVRDTRPVSLMEVRSVAARLPASNPRRRACYGALWDEPWIGHGEGAQAK